MRRRELLMAVLLAGLVAVPLPPVRGADAGATVRIPFSDSIMLEAWVSKPDGDGPFPVAVVSHGDPRRGDDRQRMHSSSDYGTLRAWLLGRGFALIIPMRRGFGSSDGQFAEGYGPCDGADYAAAGLAAADDIDSAHRYMRTQPFVDRARIVLIGQSGGGLASLAEASRNPPGVVAVINFAGGRGSASPDFVCSPNALVDAMARFGKTAKAPSLWIYAENDHFFGPVLARRMFDAFAAGSPQAEFAPAPSSGSDGHGLVHTAEFWPPVVATFLNRVGFAIASVSPAPNSPHSIAPISPAPNSVSHLGEGIAIAIKTTPGALCTVTVRIPGESRDRVFSETRANAEGIVSWDAVGVAPPGRRNVTATCSLDGNRQVITWSYTIS